MTFNKGFTRFATMVARATGRPATFVLCVATIVIWASAVRSSISPTWQLVINTGTTIITFLQEEGLTELRTCEGDSAKADRLEKALDAADDATDAADEKAREASAKTKPRFS